MIHGSTLASQSAAKRCGIKWPEQSDSGGLESVHAEVKKSGNQDRAEKGGTRYPGRRGFAAEEEIDGAKDYANRCGDNDGMRERVTPVQVGGRAERAA